MKKINENSNVVMSDDDNKYFPIRTVSEITGVNSITLRAWERRYGLLVPHRTPKGHRLYTQDDIDLIHQAVELLNKGISISQVKSHLLPNKINKKSKQAEKVQDFSNVWVQYQQRILNSVVRFDSHALSLVYNEVLAIYPLDVVTTHLILPLSRRLGDRWEKNEGTIAEEHFFSQFLRNKIGARFHHMHANVNGPKIVTACFPKEQHEIGLLIFCLAASEHGYDIITLGSDLPLSEIDRVVKQVDAEAVVLSGTSKLPLSIIENDLELLVNDSEVPIFVGGSASVLHCEEIKNVGALPIGQDIHHAISEIDLVLEIEN